MVICDVPRKNAVKKWGLIYKSVREKLGLKTIKKWRMDSRISNTVRYILFIHYFYFFIFFFFLIFPFCMTRMARTLARMTRMARMTRRTRKMAHRHKMSDQCALDKICCSLNGTQHCSARLPPPATPLLKDYWHGVPFYWLVYVHTRDLHDIRSGHRYLFVSINRRPNSIATSDINAH